MKKKDEMPYEENSEGSNIHQEEFFENVTNLLSNLKEVLVNYDNKNLGQKMKKKIINWTNIFI